MNAAGASTISFWCAYSELFTVIVEVQALAFFVFLRTLQRLLWALGVFLAKLLCQCYVVNKQAIRTSCALTHLESSIGSKLLFLLLHVTWNTSECNAVQRHNCGETRRTALKAASHPSVRMI